MHTYTSIDVQSDRQTDKQTDRQTDSMQRILGVGKEGNKLGSVII